MTEDQSEAESYIFEGLEKLQSVSEVYNIEDRQSMPEFAINQTETLQNNCGDPIERLVTDNAGNLSYDVLKRVKIKQQPLTDYWPARKLKKILRGDFELEDVQEVVGLLCAIAAHMANNSQSKEVEKKWETLDVQNQPTTGRAAQPSSAKIRLYQCTVDLICDMIKESYPNAEPWIRIAAGIVTIIWPHRHSIGRWIVDKWKLISVKKASDISAPVAFGAGVLVGVIGLIAIFILCNIWIREYIDSNF